MPETKEKRIINSNDQEKIQDIHARNDIKNRYKAIEDAKKSGFHGLAAGMEFFINQDYQGK